MRGEAPYALMRLQRQTKAFTACGRIMRLNVYRRDEENDKHGTPLPEPKAYFAC